MIKGPLAVIRASRALRSYARNCGGWSSRASYCQGTVPTHYRDFVIAVKLTITGHLQIAKAFNMNIIAWSPHLTREKADEAGVGFVSTKDELFKQSDIVSVHMVLSESTRGLIGASDFAQMKPTAFFINTSRGPLVDEAALIDALKQKKLAGAGLDVFDVEPLPIDHPLRKLSNVTLSPHTGYVSDDNYGVSIPLALFYLRPGSKSFGTGVLG